MIRSSISPGGLESYEIHRDFLPTLLHDCPQLGPRKTAGWYTAESKIWREGGIGCNPSTMEKAFSILRDQRIAEAVASGKTQEEAEENVSSNYVAEQLGPGGKSRLRASIGSLADLAEIIQNMPHQMRQKSPADDHATKTPARAKIDNISR